jgi:hypothetical protein
LAGWYSPQWSFSPKPNKKAQIVFSLKKEDRDILLHILFLFAALRAERADNYFDKEIISRSIKIEMHKNF